MLTDTVVYANELLLEAIRRDQSLEQAANIAMLPGIVGRALAMPDIHQGYGFLIGGVAAVDEQHGVVSPGGVGFDINCGVRLLGSNLTLKEVKPKLRELVHQLFRDVPSGTGQSSRLNTTWDQKLISTIRKNAVASPKRIPMQSATAQSNGVDRSLEPLAPAITFWKCNLSRKYSTRRRRRSTTYTRIPSCFSFIPVRVVWAIRCAPIMSRNWMRR